GSTTRRCSSAAPSCPDACWAAPTTPPIAWPRKRWPGPPRPDPGDRVSALAGDTDARAAVAGVRRWYHCLEVAPGVVTPGLFDLRPVVDRLPWPEVRGRRCLDVGTADGYF